MAQKKRSKKNTKTKAKKKKLSVFTVVLLLIVIVVVGALGYLSIQKLNPLATELAKIQAEFNEMPDTIMEPIDFFEVDANGVKGEWVVDENYFPSLTTINRPTYLEGDKTTTIKLVCEVSLSPIDELFNQFLGIIKTTSFERKVKIIALPMTNEDKVSEFLNNLNLSETIYTDLFLRTSSVVYEDLICSWESSNPSIIDDSGNIIANGEVELICTVTLGDVSQTKKFKVKATDPIDSIVVDTDFSDYEDNSYKNTDSFNGLSLINALADSESIKFKVGTETNGQILSEKINNFSTISFTYEFHSSSKGNTYSKNTYIDLLYSDDGITFTSLKKETLVDSNKHDFEYTFSGETGFIKVEITTEYADKFVVVDNFRLTRKFNSDDVIEALKIELPNKVKSSCDLPLTTIYGGNVSYQSNSANFTELGKVVQTSEKQEVTLSVIVTGFDFDVKFDYVVSILGLNSVTPVEVRFIDLGKYGSSDCGESIYIKYDTIDILIDAGDRYESTFLAVKECIETYSEDRVLEYVIATHPDSDHIGSMDNVLLEFDVKYVVTFSMFDTDTSGVFNAYKEALVAEDAQVCTGLESVNGLNNCTKVLTIADDVFIEILDTKHYEDNGNNPRSIVCVLNAYGTRILFTGDADNNPKNIEEDYKDQVGNIDILKLVHHGTSNGTTASFVAAIDPEVGIITNGAYLGNKHGHPTYEAIATMYEYDQNMLIYAVAGGSGEGCELGTSFECKENGDGDNRFHQRNGMITIEIDNNGYQISSEYYGDNPIEIMDTDFYKAYKEALGK